MWLFIYIYTFSVDSSRVYLCSVCACVLAHIQPDQMISVLAIPCVSNTRKQIRDENIISILAIRIRCIYKYRVRTTAVQQTVIIGYRVTSARS